MHVSTLLKQTHKLKQCSNTIEKGFIQKARQRSSHVFGGKVYSIPCPIAVLPRSVESNPGNKAPVAGKESDQPAAVVAPGSRVDLASWHVSKRTAVRDAAMAGIRYIFHTVTFYMVNFYK